MELYGYDSTDRWGVRTFEVNDSQTRLVLTNQQDEIIRNFSLLSGECIGDYRNFSREVSKIVFDDERIIGAGSDGTVRIINHFGQTEWEFELGGKIAAIRKYKHYVIVGSNIDSGTDASHIFFVIDIARKQMIKPFFHSLSCHEGIDCVVDPEDGSCYASSNEGTIIRFGVEPDDHRTRLIHFDTLPIRHINLVNRMGRKYLLCGFSDRKVRAYCINDKDACMPAEYFGHTDKINGIEVLPPPLDNYFVSASRDSTAVLWKIGSDKPLQTFTGHTDWVWDVRSFRRRNRTYIMTCGQDGQILIHSIYGKCLGKLLNLAYGYYLWVIPDHDDGGRLYVKTNLEKIPERFIGKKYTTEPVENLDRIWI